jgi:hypothetical protein
MLILPTASSAAQKDRAQQLLTSVAGQRLHCTIVVFGDTERAREIASRADVRAENNAFRKVVWIPDIAVLAGNSGFAVLADHAAAGAEAVALTLRFQPSCALRGGEAVDFFKLELAFADALAGKLLS